MNGSGCATGRLLPVVLLLLIPLFVSPPLLADGSATSEAFARLDRDVQTALGGMVSARKPVPPQPQKYASLLNATSITDRPQQTLDIIHGIKSLLLGDPGHRDASKLVAALFRLNQTWLIEQIRTEAEATGETGLTAIIDLHRVAHDGSRNQWSKAATLINNNLDELGEIDGQYAQLLLGIAQQRQKRHRHAIDHYRKIPNASRYYLPAQINLATAYIRQGWVSEVRELIGGFSKANAHRLQSEPEVQRLLVILGYALLTREYYQDAANSFTAIPETSIYRNRALLGRALALISQEKFRAALQPIQQLIASGGEDLPAQEAYLLLPSVYQKSNETRKAANAFNQAIDHYLTQIDRLKAIASAPPTPERIGIDVQNQFLDIDGISISYQDLVPQSFMLNLILLRALSDREELAELLSNHEQTLRRLLPKLIQRKLNPLRSYLSQSRYGLARFHDR